MTATKAKSLAADLLAKGLEVTITPRGGDDFSVCAKGAINVGDLTGFLTKYSVSTPPVKELTFL